MHLLAGKGDQHGDIGKKSKGDDRSIHEDEAILSQGSDSGAKR